MPGVRPSYRFLASPRWIAFHVVVVLLVVLMVNLGFWQLDRYRQKHDANLKVQERSELPAVDVRALAGEPAVDVEWRPVSATGTYDGAEQVAIRNRSFEGTGGLHLVTPLVLDDGTAVLVNRGWIPVDDAAAPPAPVDGTVVLAARVRPTQERGSIGPRDPADGELTELARVDVARIQQQVPYPLLPFYVELVAQEPAAADRFPLAIPEPAFDDGPHLSYMAQWWIFSVCAVVGWVVVVRKSARQRAKDAARAGREAAAAAAPGGGGAPAEPPLSGTPR